MFVPPRALAASTLSWDTVQPMKTTSMEKIIYFQDYVVTNAGTTPLEVQQLLTDEEYRAAKAESDWRRSLSG